MNAPAPTSPAAPRDITPILSATDMSVRFGGLKALNHVTIEIPQQTIVGLLGPNGAGKSTLLGVLSGDVHAQQGDVVFDGSPITGLVAQARVRRGLARTFQHPELFGELTVRDHLTLAQRLDRQPSRSWSDPLTARYLRPEPDIDAAVTELLQLLGLFDVADATVAGLPLGVCRLVEIGRAVATNPRMVLLDEPFSGLNAAESTVLSDALSRIIATRGVSMLLVEHDVETVFALSSKVYVLDFGELIAVGTPTEIRANQLVRTAYLGEVAAEPATPPGRATVRQPPAESAGTPAPTASTEESILQIDDLTVTYANATAIDGVSLSVGRKSVTALLGANGAGKSTLARATAGLVAVRAGTIKFADTDITGMAPDKIRRLGVAYLPEGRGVFPTLTVGENLRMAVQTAAKQQRSEAIERAVTLFPILGERRTQLAGTLSGGQQQMLSLARVLALQPRILIADEVSLGLAPLIVDEVFEGLQRAIDMDVSVVIIEQFVHRALAMADDCHILRRGKLVWSGKAAAAHGEIFDHYLGNTADDEPPGQTPAP